MILEIEGGGGGGTPDFHVQTGDIPDTLSRRHVMPMVHDSAADMPQDEPEHRHENRLERWIHVGKNN